MRPAYLMPASVNFGAAALNISIWTATGGTFSLVLFFISMVIGIMCLTASVIRTSPEPKALAYNDRWDNKEYVSMIHQTRELERVEQGEVKTECECDFHKHPKYQGRDNSPLKLEIREKRHPCSVCGAITTRISGVCTWCIRDNQARYDFAVFKYEQMISDHDLKRRNR